MARHGVKLADGRCGRFEFDIPLDTRSQRTSIVRAQLATDTCIDVVWVGSWRPERAPGVEYSAAADTFEFNAAFGGRASSGRTADWNQPSASVLSCDSFGDIAQKEGEAWVTIASTGFLIASDRNELTWAYNGYCVMAGQGIHTMTYATGLGWSLSIWRGISLAYDPQSPPRSVWTKSYSRFHNSCHVQMYILFGVAGFPQTHSETRGFENGSVQGWPPDIVLSQAGSPCPNNVYASGYTYP